MKKTLLVFCLSLSATVSLWGQGPGGPPPLQPLNPPPAPAGNPVTADKANLGKALFWDEQLSSTRTISCGTCHQPVSGGSDPRSLMGTTDHPGADGAFGTADDVTGSPGVLKKTAVGLHELDDFFGIAEQVTGRYAPSAINAGYSPALFWDGRAAGRFVDPVSGQTVLANGAALESQAIGPPTSPVEMAHAGRDWVQIASRIAHSVPLTLSPSVPADLTAWINDRDYTELFEAAFGTAGVTPARIAMAIATYERTLVSNQAPIDAFIAGNQNALTAQEQQGLQVFNQARCATCHGGNRFTDDRFHYIGVRPQDDDLGRFNVTGNNADRGRFKTPTLRNVALRGEFMHNGQLASLEDVVEFYNRGGDFDAPNKDNDVRPLNLTVAQKAALVAFLGRPLTDPRVAAESGVFSRPALYADSASIPTVNNDGVSYASNPTPELIAIEPALAGSPDFTVATDSEFAGRSIVLVVDDAPIVSGIGAIPAERTVLMRYSVTADNDGLATVPVSLPGGNVLRGKTIYGKWFVTDEGGPAAESPSFEVAVFGETAGLLGAPQNVFGSFGEGTVSLVWDSVNNADRYEVYRGSTNVFAESVRLGETTSTTFADDSAASDTTVFYWIVAVNEDEASEVSRTSVATSELGSFDLSVVDGAAVELSWTQELAEPASFQVWRGISENPAGFTEIETGLTSSGYSDSAGTAARTYYYRVVMVDGAGETIAVSSVESGSRSFSAPTNLSASDETLDDRIRLNWSSHPDATSYDLYRSNGGSATFLATTAATTYDDFAVTAGLGYTYTVRARNQYGESADSASASGSKGIQAPAGVTANYDLEQNAIVINWNAAEGTQQYAVFRSATGSFQDAEEIAVSDGTSWTDATGDPGAEYTYWIASIDAEENRLIEPSVLAVSTVEIVAPDAKVGRTLANLSGDDIYNANGAGQTLRRKTRKYRTIVNRIVTENDGTMADSLRYVGTASNRKFRVKYRTVSPVAANITGAVIAGTAASEEMDSAAVESIVMEIKPIRSRQKNRNRTYRHTGQFVVVSTLDGEEKDCVRLITKAKY